MRLDVMYFVALLGVDLHDMLHEVLRLLLDIARYQILAGENFLVQLVRVCVLKGQVTGNHCEEDDSAGPDIDAGTIVLKTVDHLRRRIARRATCCL